MDETYLWQLFGVLIKEMALYIVAIMIVTELIKGSLKWIPNQLISVIVGLAYGIGAWSTGYLDGTIFEVVGIKSPIAILFAQAAHDRIYQVIMKQVPEATKNITIAVKGIENGKDP